MGSISTARRVLPFVIFPTISAVAVKFIFQNIHSVEKYMRGGMCNPGTPLGQAYTGYPKVDESLCHWVSFFHASMDPATLPFVKYFFLSAVPTISLMMFTESARRKRPAVVGYPNAVGLIYQVITFGLFMPLYWMAFVVSGNTQRKAGDSSSLVTNGRAVAFGCAYVMGAILPFLAMVHTGNPYIIALWQPFPAYVALFERAILFIRPESKHSESGYSVIKTLYLLCIATSSVIHINAVLPLFSQGGLNGVLSYFQPSTSPLQGASFGALALDFLQWDVGLGMLAAVLATLFFAKNTKELLGLASWFIIFTPVLGIGATVASVALRRESKIHRSL